jgi:hypothetical protein
MRTYIVLTTAFALGACLAQASPVQAQTTISDAECQTLRQRLAEHARLSEGVRRAVTAQASTTPSAAPTPAPIATAAPGRAEAIRARLEKIPAERQALEEQRLGAMMKFDVSRAGKIQSQISALDTEKVNLERELTALPTSPSASPTTTTAATPSDPTMRVRCQDMPAAVDNALRTRRRELGAREDQLGAIPLVGLKGQTSDQIGQELAAQFAAGPAAATQVGLLDADGNGKLDAFVDVPAPGVFRLVRQRGDGTVSMEVFPTSAAGATPGYGEMTRRLDEETARQAKQTPADLLATRPAGPVRATTQTAEFASAYAQFQAGNFAEAARPSLPAARSMEFPNFQGQSVRVLEIVSPVSGGVSVRRAVAVAQPNDQELWEETTTTVRPSSYWRTDVEVARTRQARMTSGAPVGTPTVSTPITFSLER